MDSTKLEVKNELVDPCLIHEARHTRPLNWKNDQPAFTGASSKLREQIRKSVHEKAR